jgi:hypothetical protein
MLKPALVLLVLAALRGCTAQPTLPETAPMAPVVWFEELPADGFALVGVSEYDHPQGVTFSGRSVEVWVDGRRVAAADGDVPRMYFGFRELPEGVVQARARDRARQRRWGEWSAWVSSANR